MRTLKETETQKRQRKVKWRQRHREHRKTACERGREEQWRDVGMGMCIQRNRGEWEETYPALSKGGPLGTGPERRNEGRENYSKGPGKLREDEVKKTPPVSAPEKPRGEPENSLAWGCPPQSPVAPQEPALGAPRSRAGPPCSLGPRAVEPVIVGRDNAL